jgi:hypothetical protein
MFRQFALLLILLAMSFTSPASADVLVTTKHTLLQKMFPRGVQHFACTSPENLKNFLDQGFAAVKKMQSTNKNCGLIPMTAISGWPPKRYRADDGTVYDIYQFNKNGWDFYTYYKRR